MSSKYQLKFSVDGLPGVGTMSYVAGECEADSPFEAGQKLEKFLQSRLGTAKYRYLSEAKIVDESGKDCAFLQMDETCRGSMPSWGHWLTVRD